MMKKQEIINFWKKLWITQNNILKVLEKITDLNSSQLFLLDEIDDNLIEEIEIIFSRLVSWEPIEYILKKADFFGLDFYVDSRVLVPRNDTEVMIKQVIKYIPKNTIFIDVWTGSSCIPITILQNTKNIKECFVIDISKEALEVSKINIKKYNSYLDSLNLKEYNSIIITANLPYVKNWDFKNMDEETIEFEPDLALYGWEKTGFELYERLIYQIFDLQLLYDIKEIILFIEIGFDQKQIATKFLEKQNLKFEIFKDNWGIDRCIKISF